VEQLSEIASHILVYGTGSAATAFALFRWLGKSWIENKFAQRLEQFRHEQALDLQRLRVEIDAMLSGALKLQEKEFSVLPEAWQMLDEAHGLVSWLASPIQQYADVSRMTAVQLEEHLGDASFTESQKDEVRNAHDRANVYQHLVFLYRLQKVKISISALRNHIARNGIFLTSEIEEKFTKLTTLYWSAILSIEIGREADDFSMVREGWKEIENQAEPLYRALKLQIQNRLQSHAKK
jgi:hypothetical protein